MAEHSDSEDEVENPNLQLGFATPPPAGEPGIFEEPGELPPMAPPNPTHANPCRKPPGTTGSGGVGQARPDHSHTAPPPDWSKWDGGQIGGKPFWLDPKDLPPPVSQR